MAAKCLGGNADGSPCSAAPRPDGYCLWHSPALAEQRAGWRRRGGAQRSNRARAKRQFTEAALSPAEIEGLLSIALQSVLAGELEPGVGTAAATIARALVAVAETASLQEQIDELRRALGRAS